MGSSIHDPDVMENAAPASQPWLRASGCPADGRPRLAHTPLPAHVTFLKRCVCRGKRADIICIGSQIGTPRPSLAGVSRPARKVTQAGCQGRSNRRTRGVDGQRKCPPGQTSPNGGFVGCGAPAVRPGGPQFRRFVSGGPSRATDNPVLAERLRPRVGRHSGRSQGRPLGRGRGAVGSSQSPIRQDTRRVAEKQQQSKVARRRGGRRRDDLKDSAYKMPQIVIEQEPASLSPNPPKDDFGDSP